MGHKLILRAADGHQLGAYRADAPGMPKGRVVVVQEIFGVNRHIRAVCDRLAQAGYTALAPQIFDRLQRDFECGYSDADVARAREFLPRLDWDKTVADTRAAVDALKAGGPVAVLGFCMGGTVAFLAATKIDGLAAAVCFYGGMIAKHADSKPRCPTQMHFGETDSHIPMSDVANIRAKRPESEIHVYPGAGHGFYCEERGSYEPRSAGIGWERALAFFARHFAAARPQTPPARPAPPLMARPASPPMPSTMARPVPPPARPMPVPAIQSEPKAAARPKPKTKPKKKAKPKSKAKAKKRAKTKTKAQRKARKKAAKKARKAAKKRAKKARKKGKKKSTKKRRR
jgi:carboxymethylenebutenolidase